MRPAVPATDRHRIPVHLLTGFLGSGKTTLLQHLLAEPGLADTAVIINEFGEVGLDHLLVREVKEDVVLLSSGCLCCAVRDDLVSTLADLLPMVRAGEIEPFSRVIIETTGLANPAPVMHAVMSEPRLTSDYRAGTIIATLDAVSGTNSIRSHVEAVQQVGLADLVVVTKADLVEDWQLQALVKEVRGINQSALHLESRPGAIPDARELFDGEPNWHDRLLAQPHSSPPRGIHNDHTKTFTIEIPTALEWSTFVDWLELLLLNRGQSILRVKGLLAINDDPRPVVINGVQHVVYPPEYLPRWPEGEIRPWLVFIARDLNRSAIERSLASITVPSV